jgi:two-component system, cell cycle response regulator DivK
MHTILLVEDNEMNREMLRRRLARSGYSVVTAVDGPEAVRKAREERPNLILMDVALGAMDGWEATLAIKRDPRSASAPVIALTAHALESDQRRSVEVGCAAFDTKPVDYKRLLEKIDQLLARTANQI